MASKGSTSPVFKSSRHRRKKIYEYQVQNTNKKPRLKCLLSSPNNEYDSDKDLFNDSFASHIDFQKIDGIENTKDSLSSPLTSIDNESFNNIILEPINSDKNSYLLDESSDDLFKDITNTQISTLINNKCDGIELTSSQVIYNKTNNVQTPNKNFSINTKSNISNSKPYDELNDIFKSPSVITSTCQNTNKKENLKVINEPTLKNNADETIKKLFGLDDSFSDIGSGCSDISNTRDTPEDKKTIDASPSASILNTSPSVSFLNTSLLSVGSTQNSQQFLGRVQKKLADPSLNLTADFVSVSQQKAKALEEALTETKNQTNQPFELGPFYGLPSKVLTLLESNRNIKELYKWQEECLQSALDSKNFLLSLPTSGGKTLIAEILLFRELLLKKLDVIFILPYVALVQEKVRGLSPFGIELGFLIEEYAGSRGIFPPKKRRKKRVVYVATIEKANGLVNSLLENDRINELGLVIIDEAHMIGETGTRGAILECTITKLKYAGDPVKLLGMSATIGNLNQLAEFMNAKLFTGMNRPVDLKEYVKFEQYIAEINPSAKTEEELLLNQKLCSFPYTNEQKKLDADMVCGIITEVVPDHSCLVFCATKVNCENLAKLLTKFLNPDLVNNRKEDKIALFKAIVEEGGGTICPILKRTIPFGIAYHHSGLTDGERRLLEEGYLAGTLWCITCTSTLAAGVNLPAKRVIIRSPYTGNQFLTRSRYQQMIGRAGRAGFNTNGESFLVIQNKDIQKVGELLLSPIEICRSTLGDDDYNGLIGLIFSSLGLGIVKNIEDLFNLVQHSLYFLQIDTKDKLKEKVIEIIEDLRKKALVRIKIPVTSEGKVPNWLSDPENSQEMLLTLSEDSTNAKDLAEHVVNRPISAADELSISRLGKAAIKGCIELRLAKQLYKDLILARESLAVHCHLHLLYLVTPYTAVELFKLHPDVFYSVFNQLGPEEVKVAGILGITEGVVIRMSMGQKPKNISATVLHRFYVALLLNCLLDGKCIWKVSNDFKIHRGLAQQTLVSAAAFSSCVYLFCQELEEFWAFRDLLASFSKIVSGCSSEVLPLMDIPAVKIGRAKMLHKGGYKTIQDVARANPADLVKVVEHLSRNNARQIIDSAKMLILEKYESLQEEAEEYLLGIQN